MATETYTAIASITLGSSASSVTFSSIPQDYRDLVFVLNVEGSIDENLTLQINGSSADFSFVLMSGNGSSTSSSSGTTNTIGRVGTVENLITVDFLDYSATDKHKTFLLRSNGPDVRQHAARWAQTAAITSIEFGIRTGGNFLTGGTFALYGIAS